MLKLTGSRRIQPEIALKGHSYVNALRYIYKRAARPDCIVKRRKFMVRRRDELPEILLNQFRIFLYRRFKIHINDALFLQLLLDIMVNHFGIILSPYTGQRFFLRFRNAQTVEGIADILRQILPFGLHVRLRTDISIDIPHVQLGNIRCPRRNIQFLINFQCLQTFLQHPLRFFLLRRNFTDNLLCQARIRFVRVLHPVLNIIDAAVDFLHMASLLIPHSHTSLR